MLFHRVEDARDDVAYSFNGKGYAVRNRVSSVPYSRYLFGISFSFRTYDENALLFLAINSDNVSICSVLLNTECYLFLTFRTGIEKYFEKNLVKKVSKY